jgi:hypothetical protein
MSDLLLCKVALRRLFKSRGHLLKNGVKFCDKGRWCYTNASIGISHFPLLPYAFFLVYEQPLPRAEWHDLILYNACTFLTTGVIYLTKVLDFFNTRCICVCGSV